jgi:hypothetical protein
MFAMSGVETEAFVSGYLAGICWANAIGEDHDESPEVTPYDLPESVEAELRQDARDFLTGDHVEQLVRGAVRRLRGYSYESAGIDYALTRNGHGAGFWDRGLGMVGDALTALSRPYGSRSIMVNSEGEVIGTLD